MNLPVRDFSASGYRSLQRIHYPMSRLDVFVGANGVGKSNLYRALELLRAAAANTLGEELARESLNLAMWAGPNKRGSPRLIRLAVGFSEPNRLEIAWRFYHDLRTDAGAPMRKPCTAVAAPTLASDGANLAAVFGTLALIRQDTIDLDRMIDRAFPGVTLEIARAARDLSFSLHYPEFPYREFEPSELSDGTLRFL